MCLVTFVVIIVIPTERIVIGRDFAHALDVNDLLHRPATNRNGDQIISGLDVRPSSVAAAQAPATSTATTTGTQLLFGGSEIDLTFSGSTSTAAPRTTTC